MCVTTFIMYIFFFGFEDKMKALRFEKRIKYNISWKILGIICIISTVL